MVSLKDRTDYSLRINESPKISAFDSLLLDKTIVVPASEELNEAEEIYFGLVKAIHDNKQGDFELYYNKKNKSHPTAESPSPFVNDDFLIFCLIVGVTRFGLDKSWIKNIVSIRSRSGITITFENIINENYYSTENLHEVILMYFKLNNMSLIKDDLLNGCYRRIIADTALFENKNDFQVLCALRSYDYILLSRITPDNHETILLSNFQKIFLKRVKFIAWLLQTALLVLILYRVFDLVSSNPKIKDLFDKIGSALKVLGLVGLSQLGNIFPVINRTCYRVLLRFFGYPKELINELNGKENK